MYWTREDAKQMIRLVTGVKEGSAEMNVDEPDREEDVSETINGDEEDADVGGDGEIDNRGADVYSNHSFDSAQPQVDYNYGHDHIDMHPSEDETINKIHAAIITLRVFNELKLPNDAREQLLYFIEWIKRFNVDIPKSLYFLNKRTSVLKEHISHNVYVYCNESGCNNDIRKGDYPKDVYCPCQSGKPSRKHRRNEDYIIAFNFTESLQVILDRE